MAQNENNHVRFIKLDDEYCSGIITKVEFIKARNNRILVGYGNCGIVSRFEFKVIKNYLFYKVKCLNLFSLIKRVVLLLLNLAAFISRKKGFLKN